MLKITGIAVITTAEGKRITYSFSEIDENGNIIASNKKRSFIAIDEEIKGLIETLEKKVSEHMVANNQ